MQYELTNDNHLVKLGEWRQSATDGGYAGRAQREADLVQKFFKRFPGETLSVYEFDGERSIRTSEGILLCKTRLIAI